MELIPERYVKITAILVELAKNVFSFVQMGHLDVVVPPDFVNEDTSGDVMVPEGGTVKLTCRARGYPIPHVLWRREDNVDLVIKEPSGVKTKGDFYK
jgi:hypothetical protein